MLVSAIALYACLVIRPPAFPPADHAQERSVRRFVKNFYEWYIHDVIHSDRSDPAWTAVTERPFSFSPQLRTLLREDAGDVRQIKPSFISLDFDPFLAGKDPDPRYVIGKVERKGSSWYVRVSAVPYKDDPKVFATTAKVEKAKTKRGWRFTNFLYDGGKDLLTRLKELKRQRQGKR
ncbi:MAG: hypothetical protein QOJ65_1439 [Fimbriimonadaceae bacterium]|jgi:hypothetical protein|nr:hypothetical protein [Fimbriimonadaceae bacterium]